MKTNARVVIIGGGVVGVSILYHLAKAGWKDVVLLERTELTAGSTWHAAGLLPYYNPCYTMSHINMRSLDLYARLEAETGQPTGFHQCGQLRLASCSDRMDEYTHYMGIAENLGIECDLVSREKAQQLWPMADMSDVLGALYHPTDGHIAPADLTQAMAKAATRMGAKIHRFTEVSAIDNITSGEWHLTTSKGDFIAEHVVTATGNYARQTGKMVGLDVPSIPVLHQFLVTEPIPEFKAYNDAGHPEMPVLRDDKNKFYLRQEIDGLILGPYDDAPLSWAVDGVPADFGAELLAPDMDRFEPFLEGTMARVSAFESAGVQSVVNGPIAHTPDANPLIGPAPGLKNYWLAEGFVAGILYAGGTGHYLSEWIMNGEPSIDMWPVDPRRFGSHVGKSYTRLKNEETYGHIFDLHYPNLELPATRPAKTSPCHDRLTQAGAVWGETGGWERANWFASDGKEPNETLSFRRSNAFESIAQECLAVRNDVGLVDLTSFAKWDVIGPDAEAFLNRVLAKKMPLKDGRVTLSHALSEQGSVQSEFTIARLGPEHFYVVGPALCEVHDEDVLRKSLSPDENVTITNITMSWGCYVVAGPKARDLLSRIVGGPLSNEGFPWFSAQIRDVGWASGVRMLRVNYLGELGWELHHPIAFQHHILDQLEEYGAEFGLRHVGFRALDSLRLEKSYRAIKADISGNNTLREANLDRFISMDKREFIGRDAVLAENGGEIATKLVTLSIDCAVSDIQPSDNQTVYIGGTVIGRTTSGGYGYFLETPLALAYLKAPHFEIGTEVAIEILGERFSARVIPDSPHDPNNERPRGKVL